MRLKSTQDVKSVLDKVSAVKKLDSVFTKRSLTSHDEGDSVQEFANGTHKQILIFDISIGKKILASKNFASINHASPFLEKLASNGQPLKHLDAFYEESILFKEDTEHRHGKKHFNKILKELSIELQNLKPQIFRYFQKRRKYISSPLMFAETFVRLYTGLMVSHLTSIPLKKVFRSFSLRHVVFSANFDLSSNKSTDKALALLYENHSLPERNTPDWYNHQVAQSLMIMGIDPMIGTICAKLVEGSNEKMSDTAFKHCATSFVSRLCVQPITLFDIDFNTGDSCYVSLVPSQDKVNSGFNLEKNNSIAYGAGIHKCIGQSISLELADLADEIITRFFPRGFPRTSVIAPEGAFLAFN